LKFKQFMFACPDAFTVFAMLGHPVTLFEFGPSDVHAVGDVVEVAHARRVPACLAR